MSSASASGVEVAGWRDSEGRARAAVGSLLGSTSAAVAFPTCPASLRRGSSTALLVHLLIGVAWVLFYLIYSVTAAK